MRNHQDGIESHLVPSQGPKMNRESLQQKNWGIHQLTVGRMYHHFHSVESGNASPSRFVKSSTRLDICRRASRKSGPVVVVEMLPSSKAHEKISPLCISWGAQRNGTCGLGEHGVIVVVMCFNVSPKLEFTVFIIVNMLANYNGAGTILSGDAVQVGKAVQPEHGVQTISTISLPGMFVKGKVL
jgi:hypothetical protein